MYQVKSDNRIVRINTKLPESLRNDFQAMATEQGTTASALIRDWIEGYVRGNTKVSSFEKYKDSNPELYKQYLEVKRKAQLTP